MIVKRRPYVTFFRSGRLPYHSLTLRSDLSLVALTRCADLGGTRAYWRTFAQRLIR